MRALVLVVLVIAGCAGPSPDGGAERGSDPAPPVWDPVEGTFVVDYSHRIEDCGSGFQIVGFSRTGVGLERPDNATWLNVTFDWVPGNPLAGSMRFALLRADGYESDHWAEGVSPVVLSLDAAALAIGRPDPFLVGSPMDCSLLVSAGTSPDQVVHFIATWS